MKRTIRALGAILYLAAAAFFAGCANSGAQTATGDEATTGTPATLMAQQDTKDGSRGGKNSNTTTAANGEAANYELPFMLSDANSVTVEHMGYTVSYNTKLRIPNWVAYELLDTELYGDFGREERFGPDPLVKGRQAYDRDYVGSGYDRGHMAPAGDMKWSSQAMKESFYLTNVCPQDHNLNKGLWNDLEKQVRYEAKYYKRVWIVCGPMPGIGKGTIGSNKVQVPAAFFKALLARRKDGTFTAIAFIFPNEGAPGKVRDYALTVDELEEKLGMDLFYSVPQKEQDAAERVYDLTHWKL